MLEGNPDASSSPPLPTRPAQKGSASIAMSSVPLPRFEHDDGDIGLASWYTAGRSDGFGDRLLMFDNTGAASLELLRFRPELAADAGFEDLLRQRVQRMATFKHPSFAMIRAVERLEGGDGLALVSHHMAGKRLAELLDAQQAGQGLHPAFVSWLVQQIAPLLTALQGHGYDIVHGALTVERIVLTTDGRVAIVEHVLGSALRSLELTPVRLWREFGIVARPTSRGEACLDARGDILQLGVVALSLLVGRRVSLDDVQQALPTLLEEWMRTDAARGTAFTAPLRQWLERALQVHPQAYRSALEAQDGLRELPAHATDSLPALMSGTEVVEPQRAQLVDPPTTGEASVAEVLVDNEPVVESSTTADVPGSVAPERLPTDLPVEPPAVLAEPSVLAAPAMSMLLPPVASDITPVTPRALEPAKETPVSLISARVDDEDEALGARASASPTSWLVKALAAVAVIEAVVIGALLMRTPSPAAPVTSAAVAVTIDAQPGSTVFVDERPAGTTPLKLSLNAATRSIRLAAPAGIPAAATPAPASANDATAAALAQAAARQRSGGIRLNAPIDLQVLEGNRVLGTSADGPIVAPAGSHQLDFVNSAVGFRVRQSVTIKAGEIATLTITPPMGRLSVNAQPWAQVLVDGMPAGETPIANLAVTLGQHEIIFRHPQLGERREIVVVRADGVTRISTTFGR